MDYVCTIQSIMLRPDVPAYRQHKMATPGLTGLAYTTEMATTGQCGRVRAKVHTARRAYEARPAASRDAVGIPTVTRTGVVGNYCQFQHCRKADYTQRVLYHHWRYVFNERK